MQLNTGFSCNSVIWIRSLPQNEKGSSRRITDDMETLSSRIGFGFQLIDISSTQQLINLLRELEHRAGNHGMRPLLHFDMHGSKDGGLFISGEDQHISWQALVHELQNINISTGNNLCVVGAACFGLRAIVPLKFDQPTPFFILLAPEHKVSVGFLEDNIFHFYESLFRNGGIDSAYSRYLSDHFKYFHCEKMLFIVVARYIKAGCKGKAGAARRERLLTEVFMQGMENTEDNRKTVREKIKNGLRPDQSLLDRYAKTFLIGRTCSFTMDQLLNHLDRPKT